MHIDPPRSRSLSWEWILLALSIAFAGWFVGHGIYNVRTADRFVTVKGVAEREVKADLALWPIQFAVTDDTNRHCGQFANRVLEQAEIVGALPRAGAGAAIVTADTVGEIQENREHVLDDGLCAVGADVAHGDAVFPGGVEVHVVDTGRRQTDEAQAFGCGNELFCQSHFVDEHEVHAVDARGNLVRRRTVEDPEIVHRFGKWRRVEIVRPHRAEIEKHGFHNRCLPQSVPVVAC